MDRRIAVIVNEPEETKGFEPKTNKPLNIAQLFELWGSEIEELGRMLTATELLDRERLHAIRDRLSDIVEDSAAMMASVGECENFHERQCQKG